MNLKQKQIEMQLTNGKKNSFFFIFEAGAACNYITLNNVYVF